MKRWIPLITAFVFLPVQASQIKAAADAGNKFLVKNIIDNHFSLGCHSSDQADPCQLQNMGEILSSFFVLDALKVNASLPKNIAKILSTYLNKEKRGSSQAYYWGYSSNSPADADDTCLGMRSLLLLGEKVHLDGLKQFYVSSENAYATFALPHTSPKPTIDISSADNLNIHPEVNANIFNLFHELHLDAKINYSLIKQFQAKEGYWHSFFYAGKYYSTYLNMAVLCETNKLPEAIVKGKNFIFTSQNKDGSWGNPGNAYDTSLALNTLIICRDAKSAAVKKGMSYLVQTQNKLGYWEHKEKIWEYIRQDNPTITWAAYDVNHVVTTALAVKALAKYDSVK